MGGFKDFILRGNVIDLATGVIIGGAFGKIVESVAADVITPLIGAIGGQPDFSAITAGPIGLGKVLNAIVGFLITAAVVYFVIVKPYSTMQAKMYPPAAPGEAPTPPDIQLLGEIRDLLKKR
jgi:large conductance mechanosensitive channel